MQIDSIQARNMEENKQRAQGELNSLYREMLMMELSLEKITISDIKTITACYKQEFDCTDHTRTRDLADKIINSIPNKTLVPLLKEMVELVYSDCEIKNNVHCEIHALIERVVCDKRILNFA